MGSDLEQHLRKTIDRLIGEKIELRARAEKAEAELAEAREEVEVLRELLENKRRSQHYEDITKI